MNAKPKKSKKTKELDEFIGKRLKAVLLKSGLQIVDMAEIIGVSESQMYRLLNGEVSLTLTHAYILGKEFDLEIGALAPSPAMEPRLDFLTEYMVRDRGEADLLDVYRSAPKNVQRAVLHFIELVTQADPAKLRD